jgi:hypothetical protein
MLFKTRQKTLQIANAQRPCKLKGHRYKPRTSTHKGLLSNGINNRYNQLHLVASIPFLRHILLPLLPTSTKELYYRHYWTKNRS